MAITSVQTLIRKCPVCETENGTDAPVSEYSREPWLIIRCSKCGFHHLREVPKYEELEVKLAWQSQFKNEAKRRRSEQPIIQWLDSATRWRLRLLPRTEGTDILNEIAPTGPAVDVGCGTGHHLSNLSERFVLNGIEISRASANQARESLRERGCTIIQGSCAEGLEHFPDNYFSAALLRSYLEHDWQAREVLFALRNKMALGGIAVCKVPNFGSWNRKIMGKKWCGIRLPDHVNYFDRASLSSLAKQAGFSFRFPLLKCLPTDDNMVAILQKC